jgi:hypothetical protein
MVIGAAASAAACKSRRAKSAIEIWILLIMDVIVPTAPNPTNAVGRIQIGSYKRWPRAVEGEGWFLDRRS